MRRPCVQPSKGFSANLRRCQLHKRRNVAEYLPTNAQGDSDRRIGNAYAMTDYPEAKAALQKLNLSLTQQAQVA